MDYSTFIIKYAEIGVKGANRSYFERTLADNVARALKGIGEFDVRVADTRIAVNALGDFDYDKTVNAIQKLPGIASFSPSVQYERSDLKNLIDDAVAFFKERFGDDALSFKCDTKRSYKAFPAQSPEINSEVGAAVLDACPNVHVDVHEPDVYLRIEVRDKVYIYTDDIEGIGGLPTGTAGRMTLLLSGGIDSPVAGYLMAKRGVQLDAVYFNAPPYTSERALMKVMKLAEIVSSYSGPIRLYDVNFTEIQMYIYDKCPHDELTIIMRRYMTRIAEKIARSRGSIGLISGESLGQVASQTAESLFVTDEPAGMPFYRPLIAFDKMDIVGLSEKIGAYETSIQPYEDCCTIFVAKHPVTKPKLDVIQKHELNLTDIDAMVDKAIETATIREITG
ncbi:MAG: tRNA 4-thiouridine(8) synthase ThiI [Lachnospiraceae bacterium]|nr:tRNA 4-thiouridine(8) synthase ThiI [Lachnospiraceae bacterium]